MGICQIFEIYNLTSKFTSKENSKDKIIIAKDVLLFI